MPLSRRDTCWTSISIAEFALARAFDDRRCQTSRTEVLHRDDAFDLKRFKAGFQQQFLQERIADLDHAAVRFLGILDRRERRAVDAVATGVGSDEHDEVADSGRRRTHDLLVFDDSNAHRVDERVAVVLLVEIDIAGDRRNAEAIAVSADTAHDAVEQILVALAVEWAEAQRVEQRDRPCTHREDVAHNAADAGCSTFVGLNRRWMVVRFDLEDDGQAIADIDRSGVFAGSLKNSLAPSLGNASAAAASSCNRSARSTSRRTCRVRRRMVALPRSSTI